MQNDKIISVGIDFGTTNSVVALARASGEVNVLKWPTRAGVSDTFRTAMLFWPEGGELHHVSGPAALDAKIADEHEHRFIQSIKTHVASALFTETRLFGKKLTIEDLVATFLTDLTHQERAAICAPDMPIAAGRPVVFAGERPNEVLAEQRLHTAYAQAGMSKVSLAFEPLARPIIMRVTSNATKQFWWQISAAAPVTFRSFVLPELTGNCAQLRWRIPVWALPATRLTTA